MTKIIFWKRMCCLDQWFPIFWDQGLVSWKTVFSQTLGWVGGCKTQNSGLHSKEEKPRDPINQPSRCNTQEGLLSVAQTGDSDLLGGRAPGTANWASFYRQKTTLSAYYIRVTK